MNAVETLNAWSISWSEFMTASLVDGLAVSGLAGLFWLSVRRFAAAQFGYLLFLLVLARLVVPLTLPVPPSWAWLSPLHTVDALQARWFGRKPPRPSAELAAVREPLPPPAGMAGAAPRHADLLPPAPSAAPRADRRTALSVRAILMLTWAAAIALLLARFVWVQWHWARLLRGARSLDPSGLPVNLDELRRRLRLGRAVPVVAHAAVGSPAVWGVWRPRLILPPSLSERLPQSQLAWVLLHELAHVRRGDLPVALVQRLAQIVYFFHPAVWLVNLAIDRQREYACDDAASAAAGCSPGECGAALVSVVERACGLAPAAALGLFHSHAFLRRRILRLVNRRRAGAPRPSWASCAVLIALAVIVLPRLGASGACGEPTQSAGVAASGKPKANSDKPGAEPKTEPQESDGPSSTLANRAAALKQIRTAGGSLIPADFEELVKARRDRSAPDLKFVQAVLSRHPVTDELRALLTNFPELESLDLEQTKITDAGLARLAEFSKLKSLNLRGANVGDEGMAHLESLTRLESLDLRGTQITGAGLVHLRPLAALRFLDLAGTKIDDQAFAAAANWPKLIVLYLGETRVGDSTAKVVSKWSGLERLYLNGTLVGDAGLAELAGLTNLTGLALRGTRISDAGLKHLARLSRLEMLDLAETAVSDAGLPQLAPLASLRWLNLSATKITDPRLEPLRSLERLEFLGVERTPITPLDVLRHLPQASPNVVKIRRALDESSEIDCVNVPLYDALKYLQTRHDIASHIDFKSLHDNGIPEDVPITAKLADITLRKTLETIFEPLHLSFAIRHEALLVYAGPMPESVLDIPELRPGSTLSSKLAATLMQPSQVDCADKEFSKVINDLAVGHAVEIKIDERSLADAGIALDCPITKSIRGVSLKSALELVLMDIDLTAVADGDALVIKTCLDAGQQGARPAP